MTYFAEWATLRQSAKVAGPFRVEDLEQVHRLPGRACGRWRNSHARGANVSAPVTPRHCRRRPLGERSKSCALPRRLTRVNSRIYQRFQVHFDNMKTLEIHVPDEVALKVERVAHEKGVSIDELVRTSLEEKLARDEEFDEASSLVLSKNAELYKRLS